MQKEAQSTGLDEETLSALRAGLGDERLNGLLAHFIAGIGERFVDMEAAVDAGRADDLRLQAHALRGSAASYGALHLSALCAELEGEGATPRGRAVLDEARREAAALTPHDPAEPGASGTGDRVRVGLANDDPTVRAMLGALIGSDPALELVGVAEDAAAAAQLAKMKRPDVMLLDWVMPGGGGPAAATTILEDQPDARIVALTASDTEGASMDMMRAGARSFLVKGCPTAEILSTIKGAMRL